MRKLPYLVIGLVLVTLAVTFASRTNPSVTEVTGSGPGRISIDELHRSVNVNALPAAKVDAEPY
jgi:hypothetical protein